MRINNWKICSLIAFLLPMSVLAQYTEKDIYAYINKYQDVAIQKMYEYKIPASITIAQGIFESGCGKSHLAVDGNNHFGIKCHNDWTGDTILIDDDELQECFRKYVSADESYSDHSLFLKNRKRYANLFELDIMDYASWARTLKADGYATNPKYADLLISLIERYGLAKLDTMYQERMKSGFYSGNESIVQVVTWAPKPKETTIEKPTQTKTPKPTQNTQPAVAPSKPEVATNKPSQATPMPKVELKVFTAIGSDFPSGSSPFSYRKVFENNKTYFVIAKKGDTYEAISEDVQVDVEHLRKFNDAEESKQPVENEIVYIETKAKTHPNRVHMVQQGETLRYISQKYGVQLTYIFKYNNLDENSIIHPGDQILLRH